MPGGQIDAGRRRIGVGGCDRLGQRAVADPAEAVAAAALPVTFITASGCGKPLSMACRRLGRGPICWPVTPAGYCWASPVCTSRSRTCQGESGAPFSCSAMAWMIAAAAATIGEAPEVPLKLGIPVVVIEPLASINPTAVQVARAGGVDAAAPALDIHPAAVARSRRCAGGPRLCSVGCPRPP